MFVCLFIYLIALWFSTHKERFGWMRWHPAARPESPFRSHLLSLIQTNEMPRLTALLRPVKSWVFKETCPFQMNFSRERSTVCSESVAWGTGGFERLQDVSPAGSSHSRPRKCSMAFFHKSTASFSTYRNIYDPWTPPTYDCPGWRWYSMFFQALLLTTVHGPETLFWWVLYIFRAVHWILLFQWPHACISPHWYRFGGHFSL